MTQQPGCWTNHEAALAVLSVKMDSVLERLERIETTTLPACMPKENGKGLEKDVKELRDWKAQLAGSLKILVGIWAFVQLVVIVPVVYTLWRILVP